MITSRERIQAAVHGDPVDHIPFAVWRHFYPDENEGQINALIPHGDRVSLALPRDQDGLIAAVAALNPRTIVVLEGSGPVLMPL